MFFDINGTVLCDDKYKLVSPTGHRLNAAIIPNFMQDHLRVQPQHVFDNLLQLPVYPVDEPLHIGDGHKPKLLPGAHKALNYRGNQLKRHKVWLQTDYDLGYKRYGYTGWQYAVAPAQARIESMPLFHHTLLQLNSCVPPPFHFNHAIATIYNDGLDNIGLHSDKPKDFSLNTGFICIKLGAPRHFDFAMLNPLTLKDDVFYSEILSPGTAVIVGADANVLTKHGVPVEPGLLDPSGSIVFRNIHSVIPWPELQKLMDKSELLKLTTKRRKLQHLDHFLQHLLQQEQ
jgi:hypothetical protein